MELVASFVRDWEAESEEEIEESEIEEGKAREKIKRGGRRKGKDKSATRKKLDDQSIGQSTGEAKRTKDNMDVRQNKVMEAQF